MRWCDRCRRRFYDEGAAFCPFDGQALDAPDAATDVDPNLGTTLYGQFQLLEAIGRGAMGTVYRAWQSGMERFVAVKLLHPELARNDIFRRRFLREARAAARLGHPNVVGVHMVGETDAGVPFLVMEYLEGETLDVTLEREGTLDLRRALAIARQIAAALTCAHAGGVIHRDLKPANIVLSRDARGADQVKMLDFGIAKLLDAPVLGEVPLTREGVIFGTPHYIAPEQAQGGAIDGRADLYSLGVLLYRMLAGRLPFDGSAVAVLVAHIGREVPSLRDAAPHVDPRVVALVMRCLAKAPADRFATADDVVAALDALAAPPMDVAVRGVFEHATAKTRRVVVDNDHAWRAPERSSRASRLRGFSGSARGRIAVALAAAALVSSGAGTGVFALLRDSTPARAADEAPEPDVAGDGDLAKPTDGTPEPPLAIDGARVGETILLSDGTFSLRASLPDAMPAGRPTAVLLDVWDPAGRPLSRPFLGVSQPSGDTTQARAVSDVPGRYRLDVHVADPGPAVFHVGLPRNGVVHLHLPIAESTDNPPPS